MNPYNYPGIEPDFDLQLNQTTNRWLRYAVKFPVARPTGYKENNVAYGEYYQPRRGANWPLAILVHGWGDRSVIPCRLLARDLTKKGIASFILYLVFHQRRMPYVIRERLPNLTPEEWFEGYQTSVIDIRQIVDWAGKNKDINKDHIAVIGISLGGIISAISMGVDERIAAGVIFVAGGNYQGRAWLRKTEPDHSEAEYSRSQNFYNRYLNEVAEKGIEEVTPSQQSYLTDPVTFATYLRQRPLLMLNAMWDERIPKQGTIDFWEACGKPEIKWYPATHPSIWLFYPLLLRQIMNFLKSTFSL
ncbi:MAG: alpha/beta hydrolase family protein [Dehalococcoidia bacterium]